MAHKTRDSELAYKINYVTDNFSPNGSDFKLNGGGASSFWDKVIALSRLTKWNRADWKISYVKPFT